MTRGSMALVVVVIAALAATSPLHAQEAEAAEAGSPESDITLEDREAQQLFEAGRLALRRGRFAEARERFERAYELSPHPEMLYNIGYAADRAGELARAIEAYEAFLEAMPEDEAHVVVTSRIAVLRELAARGDTAPAGGETAPAEPEAPSETRGSDPLVAWILGAGAAAVAGVALGLYVHASVRVDELRGACAPSCEPSLVDPLRDEVLASQVLFPIGGALLVAAVVALVLELDTGSDDAVSLQITPTGAGLRARF